MVRVLRRDLFPNRNEPKEIIALKIDSTKNHMEMPASQAKFTFYTTSEVI